MSGLDSDRISDNFSARARDLTPEAARHAASIVYVPVSEDSHFSASCGSVLSDQERGRANRFASAEDAAHFRQRRAFRRFCGARALGAPLPLSEVRFETTNKGRPWLRQLPETRFSFSSCRLGFLGAWSLTHEIGVDLEDQSRTLQPEALARQYFSAEEARLVETDQGTPSQSCFFRLWTLKEAALKSIGEGLPFGLDAFRFSLDPQVRMVAAPNEWGGPGPFDAHLIEEGNRCAAVVLRSLL